MLKTQMLNVGDEVGTEFGIGIIKAITKQWCVIKIYGEEDEISICKQNDNNVYLPAEINWEEEEKYDEE
jgi:hypothetical protein